MQYKMENLHLFSIEIESITKFLQRLKLQNGKKLNKAGGKARILENSLPTSFVTDIQR